MSYQNIIIGAGKPNINDGKDGNYFLDSQSKPNILYQRNNDVWTIKDDITLIDLITSLVSDFSNTTTTTTENILNLNDDVINKIERIRVEIIKERLNFENFILTAPAKLETAFTDLKDKIINDIITEKQKSLEEIKIQKNNEIDCSTSNEIEQPNTYNGFFRNIGRLKFDILSLLIIFGLLYFIPDSQIPTDGSNPQTAEIVKFGLLWLFATKFLLVSAGIIHAHITRKILFKYIKFRCEKEWSNNAMIIALYLIIIYGWTHGG
jgi:hypothetical protein